MLSRVGWGVLVACWATVVSAAPKLVATPDVASGIYEPGQKVTWTITVTDDGAPQVGKVSYQVLKSSLNEMSKGEVELQDGKAQVSAARDDAGTLLLSAKFKGATGPEVKGLGGAIYAPTKIARSADVPADFEAFWKAKVAELEAIPLNLQLTPVDLGDPKIEYFKFTMDNIRGKKIHGQLARPAGKTDLPALLQVQWAGVYPLQRDWVVGHAKQGWLSVNIIAHDLPIDESAEFYKQKAGKELNDYPGQGNDDRETSYFLPMFLSCHRAVRFITERDDWNKKTLIVHGGSQGGYQALVTAGLCPQVTAMCASVPAGCDHTGKQVGRAPGWPNWAGRTWQGKEEKKMLAAAQYFDAMNFAPRIKVPALVGVGLIDTVCPPEGIVATVNSIPGEHQLVIMPLADHGGDHKAYYSAFGPFLDKQRKAAQ